MRFVFLFLTFSGSVVVAQSTPSAQPQSQLKVVTVPMALDHDRIVINADIPLPNGATERVRAWVDNGDPDFYVSQRVAILLGLALTCSDKACTAPPPHDIEVGGMKVSLSQVRELRIPLKSIFASTMIASGMNVEIKLPSTALRNYDVLIDFPGHKFTIGQPGTVKFNGGKTKVIVNGENGLIQVPSQIENKKYNLALDLGSSISFLSSDIFGRLESAHSNLPQMTGAVGPANMWGLEDEPKWKLMRIDRVQYGPLFLTDVAAVDFPKDRMAFFEKRAGIPTAGLLGAEALMNYRIGLDYAHSAVYFEIGRTFNFPDFDVIGLILRPEDDGRFTILGIADYDNKPSVQGAQPGDQLVAVDGIPVQGSTMGQVLLMLGGEPGKDRRLTIERGGKQFTVVAKVEHFLGEEAGKSKTKE